MIKVVIGEESGRTTGYLKSSEAALLANRVSSLMSPFESRVVFKCAWLLAGCHAACAALSRTSSAALQFSAVMGPVNGNLAF